VLACQSKTSHMSSEIKISVSYSDSLNLENLDGRLLLILADSKDEEPRFQVAYDLKAQPIFGKNVDNLKPNEKIEFSNYDFGFPYESLSDIKPGEYYVQAVLHIYETFNLSTGQTVKLPMDNGEG